MRFYRKIVGERIYLSPYSVDDVEIYTKWAEWMNDRDVADGFGGFDLNVSLARAKKTIEELYGYRFAIVLKDDDTLIGQISIHDINHLHRNAFIGLVIGEEKYRSKGYGSEAVRLVLDYGFNTLNLHSIMLSVHEDNYAALSCYKKVGFKEAGRRREWVFKNGQYIDKIYMDILAREFSDLHKR